MIYAVLGVVLLVCIVTLAVVYVPFVLAVGITALVLFTVAVFVAVFS